MHFKAADFDCFSIILS